MEDTVMIRIGVLGAGNHSTGMHGPALQAYVAEHPGEAELAAVCDLDAAKAQAYADKFGFGKTYRDVDRMLDEERLDGLVAVTPIVLTEQIAGALLPRGIPLVIEKPPGADSQATRRLLAIAEQTGAPHTVSLNRRFNPAIARAREWMAQAAPDRPPQVVLGRMLRHNRTEENFVTGTAIHLIDAIISILGTPTEVCSDNLPTAAPAAFLTQARIAFASGGRAQCIISPVVGTLEETYEIHGQDYTIQADALNCTLRIWDRKEEVVSWSAPPDADDAYRSGTVGEMAAFIGAIAAGGGFNPDLRDGLVSLLTSEAVAAGGRHEIAV